MSTCSRCGAKFTCGMTAGQSDEPCWCTALPSLPRSAYVAGNDTTGGASCFCPQCLRALIILQQKPDPGRG